MCNTYLKIKFNFDSITNAARDELMCIDKISY